MKNEPYYVAVARLAWPDRRIVIVVKRTIDELPPTTSVIYYVENAKNREEAIAIALERGAGKRVTASMLKP